MRRILGWALALAAAVAPARAAPSTCGIGAPEHVFAGTFDESLERSYVLVPFDVAEGTTNLRAKLCYDQPDAPTNVQIRHTIDLGIYQPRAPGDGSFDVEEFRGWGGSSRLDVRLSASSATPGFTPGPIPAGEWAAELGVAAVAGIGEGDADGAVAWRLEVDLDGAPTGTPWSPAPFSSAPADPGPGWYAGDVHVHAEHSGSEVLMRETFDFAFSRGQFASGGAGLDFIALSDYVGTRQWDEIGRLQGDYPGKLVIRSAEVITYRGHVNNHASARLADHRTGAIHELRGGALSTVRAPIAPGAPGGIFDRVHAGGGWTQVNHPTTFPSAVPGFSNICRGCPWDYTDGETDWGKVDAMEVQTGPSGTPDPEGNELGPNPFTPLAIEWWDRLRRAGFRITAVGSSDSHRAGRPTPVTQSPNGYLTRSPIGEATTVVCARELSETGVREAILAGHAYVKFFSARGPDLRLEARAGALRGIMGDRIDAEAAELTARVLRAAPSPQPRTLVVLRDGVPVAAVPVPGDDLTLALPTAGPGDYRLQLQRGSAIEALSNPITLAPGSGAPPPDPPVCG